MSIATIVDIVLAVFALETILLASFGHRLAGWPGFRTILPNLAAGFSLVLATRSALADDLPAVAVFLLVAGLAHLLDLRSRLRR